jgi:hypothetical protein
MEEEEKLQFFLNVATVGKELLFFIVAISNTVEKSGGLRKAFGNVGVAITEEVLAARARHNAMRHLGRTHTFSTLDSKLYTPPGSDIPVPPQGPGYVTQLAAGTKHPVYDNAFNTVTRRHLLLLYRFNHKQPGKGEGVACQRDQQSWVVVHPHQFFDA